MLSLLSVRQKDIQKSRDQNAQSLKCQTERHTEVNDTRMLSLKCQTDKHTEVNETRMISHLSVRQKDIQKLTIPECSVS